MFPDGKVSPVQEAQMTSVLDENVHNIAVDGTFDDCQDFVKALFADPEINRTHKLGAVNSINWARILAQITYYFHAYSQLLRSGRFKPGDTVRFVVPTGNFGDVLAGYFAMRMGLPTDKLVVATNENDILHRFWQSGRYEKKPARTDGESKGDMNGGFTLDGVKAHEDGVKETLSPAMDILVSSNFERLLWFLAFDTHEHGDLEVRRAHAGKRVKSWLQDLKTQEGFGVDQQVLDAARTAFESERVSDKETIQTIQEVYSYRSPAARLGTSDDTAGTANRRCYILDPHSAIGVAASRRSVKRAPPPRTHHIALATAHPAKFANAVEQALRHENDFDFATVMPAEFKGLDAAQKRKTTAKRSDGLEGIRSIIRDKAPTSGS